MARVLLLGLFVLLLLERMLDLELGLAKGLSLKNLYIYAILGLLALGALMRGRIVLSAPPHGVNLAYLLLLGYAALSWYFAGQLNPWNLPYDRVEGFITLKRLLDQYMLFLVFLLTLRSREDALWVARGMLACIALSNLITLVDVYNILDLGIIHEREDGRVSGPMGESNQFGAFMVLFLPSILAMAFMSRGLRRVFWILGGLVSAMALLLAVSRGALSALVVGTVLGCLYLYRYIPRGQLTRGVLITGVVCAVVVSVAMLHYGDLLYERLYAQSDPDDMRTLSSGRSYIWSAALATMAEHPLTWLVGGGWNMYDNMRALGIYFYATHNTFLSFLYDLGMIGLSLYLVLVYAMLRTARSAIGRLPAAQRAELIMFVIGFIGLMWAVFFVNLYKPWLLIWAYLGLMMRVAVSASRTAEAPDGAPDPHSPEPVTDPGWDGAARARRERG
ncbi:O-antigen ligase family protein [Alkalilimnicola sp. S0819]|uniref:O-antigen ligase family protein n=1 Tax=Alkalilimnicola sp. S0819 TaxID=2613922 RepID=UPI00186A531F|nr:O-antigen ligase family protein [Alkalilimnicola sp. S0819]